MLPAFTGIFIYCKNHICNVDKQHRRPTRKQRTERIHAVLREKKEASMALTKGFLRPLRIGSPGVVKTGIVLGTGFSFLLYYLFYYFRETVRVLTGYFDNNILVVLTPRENFYYNLFYGSIAAIIGFYVFTHFVVSNSLDRTNTRRRVRQRQVLNDQAFVSWTFLSAFSRFTAVVGIFYLAMPLQFDIDFLHEFWFLFVLIPVVLFLNGWTIIVKTFGREAYRWFFYTAGYIGILSVSYASINSLNYQRINRTLSMDGRKGANGITVPRSQSQELLQRRSLVVDVYLRSDPDDLSLSFFYWNEVGIDLAEMDDYVAQWQSRLQTSERDRFTINMHIDKQVTLRSVNKLKEALRRAGLPRVHHSTAAKYSKYPTYYPAFKYWGIAQSLPPYYPEFEAFLDSAERLPLADYRVNVPASPMYRIPDFAASNRVTVAVDSQHVFLNNRSIAPDSLFAALYQLTKKYAPDFIIGYYPDESISYGRYIAFLDLLYSVTDRLRNELSYRRYQHPFDCWNYPEACDAVKAAYPRSIIEWTVEEKRLIRLIEGAQDPP